MSPKTIDECRDCGLILFEALDDICLRCEQIQSLKQEKARLRNIVERVRDYDLHNDTGFEVMEWLRLDSKQCLKDLGEV